MSHWKFKSGFYPVIPGISIRLGDYGYWDNDQWCHVGNIQDIPDCPRCFSIRKSSLGQDVSESIEVSIDGNLSTDTDIENIKAGTQLKFNKKNSLFFKGRLCDYEMYCSIDMEISPFLKKLMDDGKWEDKYWLAYYVAYSDSFISMRSKSSGASATINADLTLESIHTPKAGILASLSFDKDAIETTIGCDGEMVFAGAKFISLHSSGLFKRQLKIKYNKDNQSVTMD